MLAEHYDSVVKRFLEEEEGAIVYLSDDGVFTRALRNIVSRVIGLKGETLFQFSGPAAAMKKCLELRDERTPTVIFVERKLGERPTTDFIMRLRRDFPDIHVIVLTWEATQETVAYYFELGVSRVLCKPASANKVIEEMAIAISPPTELHKQMNRCEELLSNGDYDEALEATDKILMLKPDSARGLTMRGEALMGVGETDKAVQSYMDAHESKPIYMAPLSKLAEAFKDMDQDQALAYMKQLDDISPLNPERKIDIAEQHLRKNETDAAEAYLDRSVQVAEQEELSMVGDLTERIVDAVSESAPNLAVKYLSRVIDGKRALTRDDLIHFNRLGIILRNEGNWQDAISVYEKALGVAHDDPVVHYNMGLAYWEGEERRKAVRCFESALDLDPHFYAGSVGAAANIGALYLDLREYEQALPFLEHAVDLEPDNETAVKRLETAKKNAGPGRPSGGGSYDVDASGPSDYGRKSGGSGKPFDVDALADSKPASGSGGGIRRRKRTSGAKAFNVDEMGSHSGLDSGSSRRGGGKGFNVDDMGASGSGASFNVDEMAGAPTKGKRKKSGGSTSFNVDDMGSSGSGASFNVDEMAGAPTKGKDKKSGGSTGFNVDELAGDAPSKSSKGKKKSKKINLDF